MTIGNPMHAYPYSQLGAACQDLSGLSEFNSHSGLRNFCLHIFSQSILHVQGELFDLVFSKATLKIIIHSYSFSILQWRYYYLYSCSEPHAADCSLQYWTTFLPVPVNGATRSQLRTDLSQSIALCKLFLPRGCIYPISGAYGGTKSTFLLS